MHTGHRKRGEVEVEGWGVEGGAAVHIVDSSVLKPVLNWANVCSRT